MRVFLLFVMLFFFSVGKIYAYELVLPKEKKSIANTKYALFIGKANCNEQIEINGKNVFIASNGAFAHTVKLKDGENRIVIRSNFNTQVYKIYKSYPTTNIKQNLIEFEPTLFEVKKDNTPLRSTPEDFGLNRLSHLFLGTNLLINGEQDGFYRVILSKNKNAWISKNSVKISKDIIVPEFKTMYSETFKNATVHNIEFTEKLPYTVEDCEDEIVFKVYNPFITKDSVYTINIKKPKKYSYKTILEDTKYSFKVTEFPKKQSDLEGIIITIDAGHGGAEKGAVGCLNHFEKDINLDIALELKKILSSLGANVVMTRECDGAVSLDDRVKIARENESNIFLSIHLNSIPDIEMNIHKNRGTSVYHYNKNSKILADLIRESIVKSLKTRDDGTRTASFAVIRPTDYIGVLIEVAYMTNPIDSILYTKEDFSVETAKAIAESLLNFVNND